MELLAGLPEADIQRVLARCRRRRFAKGEVLFHEGDPADCLHIVVKGRVAVRIATSLGDRATIDFIAAGDVVGEQALLPPQAPRGATASALEPTETMALGATDFAELRAAHPTVDAVLLGIVVRRHRALGARLAEALYVGAERRVLRRLIAVAASYDGTDTIPLTQEDLAGLAGTTRETVNRVLRREAQRGALALARGKITILDGPLLAKHAGEVTWDRGPMQARPSAPREAGTAP